MEGTPEVIVGLRGNTQLFYEGYVYSKHQTRVNTIAWKCAQRVKFKCGGAVITSSEPPYLNPSNLKQHSHLPDKDAKCTTQWKLELRTACTPSEVKPAQVLSAALHSASDDVKSKVGKLQSIKRDIRRQRQSSVPPLPREASQLDIPEEWKHTGGGHSKEFLFYDNGRGQQERVLVFGTNDFLRVLGESDTWYMDGTFSVSSKLFQQLYVIRASKEGITFTCVYAFMSRKTKKQYCEVFSAVSRKISEIGIVAKPGRIMMDFELGAMQAVRTVLGPQVDVKGCFFHLSQSTWRHIQEGGLVRLYKSNSETKLYCGMIDALAFLPLKDVEKGMLLLWSTAPVELADLLLYFETTYVSGTPGNATPPPFPPEVWNVHELVMNGLGKTNNYCESWNRRFKNLVGQTNATFWAILKAVQQDESYERTKLLLPPHDALEKRVKKNQEQLKEYLKITCQDYVQGNVNIDAFLKKVGEKLRF